MKKIVPDPPSKSPQALTVHTPFAACDGHHPPLFAVCAGAPVDEAMAHLAVMLRSAYETNFQACETTRDRHLSGMLWATRHTLEASLALIDSMLPASSLASQLPQVSGPDSHLVIDSDPVGAGLPAIALVNSPSSSRVKPVHRLAPYP